MVIAVRGKRRIKVSRQAYNKVFRKKGFRVVEDEADKNVNVEESENMETPQKDTVEESMETSEEGEDVDSIPIAEMNKQQLSEYAKKHNIDTSGATSVSQARKIIQREVRNRNIM